MSALTPVLRAFEPYSPELHSLVKSSLYSVRPVTRRTMATWQEQFREIILTHDEENNWEYLKAIKSWFTACTQKIFDSLPVLVLLDAFLQIQRFIKADATSSAIMVLANLQKDVEIGQFSGHDHQNHQHNLLEEMTTPVEDLPMEHLDSVFDHLTLEGGNNPEQLLSCSKDQDKDQSSPPRKRQRILPETAACFEESDSLPICARSQSAWNLYLKKNPHTWIEKCEQWSTALHEAFKNRQDTDLHADVATRLMTDVVNTLREIRQVQAGIYNQIIWTKAVKSSGLWNIICLWSDPSGIIYWKALFVQILFRRHRISETLLLVLELWTPKAARSNWVLQDKKPKFSSDRVTQRAELGRHVYDALRKFPDMIPRQALPSSVFFLLNLENFKEAGTTWLGYALESKNKNANFLNSEESTKRAYDELIRIITTNFAKSGLGFIKDRALRVIFERTVQFRQLKSQVSTQFFKNRTSRNAYCKTCKNEPDDKKCVQKVMVDIRKIEDHWIGCGVSYSPREKVSAIPTRNKKDGDFETCPLIHPIDVLGLTPVRCSSEILEHCGTMTYFFHNKKNPDEILDFWTFGAFPEEILERLISHHEELQNLKGIKRGKQFDTYSQGKMIALGSRAPAGGAAGDAYCMYAGMDAVDEKSIHALFNNAEDCMFLLEAARVIHPPVYEQLQDNTTNGDKLGTSGATAYLCKNYASPLHSDDDICPGLCAQYELLAKKEGDEYAFIYGDYGIYVVSQSNCLWSFKGSTTHGTVLPSTDPLEEGVDFILQEGQPDIAGGGPPPPRKSNGGHVTKTKRNSQAAQKYRNVRLARQQIYNYWEGL